MGPLIVLFLFWFIGQTILVFSFFVRGIKIKPVRPGSAIILVLGDIGRSPRMMYHAKSLASHGYRTKVVGYSDTTPLSALKKNPLVELHGIANPPKALLRLPWVARAPIRIVWQLLSVMKITLWDMEEHSEVLIVQNPPSIPTLALTKLIAWFSGTKIIIDWHNTGYSILAMRVGERSPLCGIARWFEATFGRTAYAHLFVTKALQDYLVNEWKLKGKFAVLHDRPPSHFQRTTPDTQKELFQRLLPTLTPSVPGNIAPSHVTKPVQPSQPAIIVSSTSWTADEDFTPFLTALDTYYQASTSGTPLPKLLVLITGKGSLRSSFETAIAKREKTWNTICVRCVFLSAEDYPTLLGCADLGVSMHSSSSGRDLPMKVVDMFGCGTPVLARNFAAIGELVKDGKNGRVWSTGEELGRQMIELLQDFPGNKQLQTLQSYFDTSSGARKGEEWGTWDENWDKIVLRDLLSGLEQK